MACLLECCARVMLCSGDVGGIDEVQVDGEEEKRSYRDLNPDQRIQSPL